MSFPQLDSTWQCAPQPACCPHHARQPHALHSIIAQLLEQDAGTPSADHGDGDVCRQRRLCVSLLRSRMRIGVVGVAATVPRAAGPIGEATALAAGLVGHAANGTGRYRHAAGPGEMGQRQRRPIEQAPCKMCTEDQSPTTALLVEVPVPTMLVAEQAGARPPRRGWSTIAAVGYARVRLDPADVRTAVKELHALDVDSANIHLDRGMARQRDTPTLQESHRKSPAGRQPGNGEPRPIGAQLGRTDSCGWAARTTAGSAHRGSYLPGGQVR